MTEHTNSKLATGCTPALDVLVAKYGTTTAVIYGYIWRREQGSRHQCDASLDTIGKDCGLSGSAVSDRISKSC